MQKKNSDSDNILKEKLNLVLDFIKSIPDKIKGLRKPRIYKLRGYTTTSRVDKKVKSEINQRILRNILIGLIFILIIALLMIIFNPFRDLREIFRIIGI